MLVIRGRSTHALVVLGGICVLGLVGIGLSIFELRDAVIGRRPWPQDAALPYDAYIAITKIAVPLIVLMLLLFSAGAAFSAPRFARARATLVMTSDKLHFPLLPGLKTGRSIAWDDLESASLVAPETASKRLRELLKLNAWVLGPILHLELVLRRPRHEACKTPWYYCRPFYLLDALNSRSRHRNWVLEMIHASGHAISALARDDSLRTKYGGSDATYSVIAQGASELTFELDEPNVA